ncbi:MAG TPA: 23S rRNA (guanosine(2251)-2'-O)-methyltransferase RlmB [Candidatus Omnitrophota bacterium]|nr:23S rRNA (guanosine(2251)-2'-O)-methyltransferase RlmB [Candidatus Omnitrophota bacterium]
MAGKNPVFERLRANPRSIRRIYLEEGFSESGFVRGKAKKFGIPVLTIHAAQMHKIGRDKNTQGILADVDDAEYVDFDELLEHAVSKKRTLIFLDELTDPQNLGAIIRSLGSLGRFSLVLPQRHSVGITETVLRIASGGENYVPVAQVSNLNHAIEEAKESGFTIIGAVTRNGENIYEVELPAHIGLVIGGEQKGIREGVMKNLDIKITIPMLVDTMSLNVAAATTLLCYETIKQKFKKT